MTTWLPRGLVFAIGMVLLRLAQGTLINANPTNAGTISFALLGLIVIGALIWGFLDGMADARANPDPDRRGDLAMRWLMAGLLAGVLSGLVTSLISRFYTAVYAEGIVPEVTALAAFTALLVFLPAMVTVALGRRLVDHRRPDKPRVRVYGRTHEDVFDAVRDDEPRTGPIYPIPATAGATDLEYPEEYPSQVALAEREEFNDETEEITRQIRSQADRIDSEIDDIEGRDTPR
jgi:hypothetical protein